MANEATLPTEEEIAQLPRWARVAFAARCARRVLPLFRKRWSTASEEQVRAIHSAVELAENSAAAAAYSVAITAGARFTANAAAAAAINARAANARAAANAAVAASAANIAVNAAAEFADADAANAAALATANADAAGSRVATPSIRADFQRILDESQRGKWDDNTPVAPSIFEPLEAISPLTDDAGPGKALILELFHNPDTDPKDIGTSVVRLWEVANEYHMTRGGGVLTFDEFKQLIPALVPVGPESRG